MKYFLLALLLVLVLPGCKTTQPEPIVITKTVYVDRLPPSQLLEVPAPVEPVKIKSATQADASRFLIDVYNRMVELENKLIGIARFYTENKDEDR